MDRQIKVVLVVLIINFSIVPVVSNYYGYHVPRTHEFIIEQNGIQNNSTWGISVSTYVVGQPEHYANYTTHDSSLSVSLPYGYYDSRVIEPAGFVTSRSSTYFHLSRSSVFPEVSIQSFRLYNLSFTEHGLIPGYQWQVALNSGGFHYDFQSNQSYFDLQAPALNYTYSVIAIPPSSRAAAQYPVLPSAVSPSGTGTVNMTPSRTSMNVSFTGSLHPASIVINASNRIPASSLNGIGVKIDGKTLYSTYSFQSRSYSAVNISLPTGTYQYVADNYPGYTIINRTGSITVNETGGVAYVDYYYRGSNGGIYS